MLKLYVILSYVHVSSDYEIKCNINVMGFFQFFSVICKFLVTLVENSKERKIVKTLEYRKRVREDR